MVDRQCPGGFNYKRYKRNAALNAAFFFACFFAGLELSLFINLEFDVRAPVSKSFTVSRVG
jgi:hypothetical protein